MIILEVKQNHFVFVFLASDSRDKPSSYVVEIRREAIDDWEELRVLSGTESGNITVNILYDLNASVTYDVRVFPIFEYGGLPYRGHAIQATFTAQMPPVGTRGRSWT